MPTDRVTVVIPTYNESENISAMAMAVTGQGYKLLIVDDSSPDGTADIASRCAEDEPLVSVLIRPGKQGLGPAYVAGFDRAIDDGAEIVVEMDADFSHDPSDLPRLVAAVDGGADVAIGSRYVPGGATPDWPLGRKLISRGGNIYVRFMLGLPIRDATAGFRAYRVASLRVLPYREAQASGYAFQVEMAWRASQAGLKIAEVPISFKDREFGTSKMGTGIVLEAMRLVTVWGLRRIGDKVMFWRR